MHARTLLKLSRLRDIGFAEWDPLGLLATNKVWDHQPFADEYDSYLLEVAARIRRDWHLQDAVDFLVNVECHRMALDRRSTTTARAEATVAAIKAYLESIDGPE